jgi:hypothetical protein
VPTPTYTPLATQTLTSAASTVTFSSIPATYRDLILIYSAAITDGGTNRFLQMTFNSDTTLTNYTNVAMAGTGSVANSASFTNFGIAPHYFSDLPPNVGESSMVLQVLDYSATDKHKTVLSRSSRGNFGVTATASRWADTAAISQMVLGLNASTWKIGSTFSLYGVN